MMKRLLLVTTSALALSCLNTAAIADGHDDDLWTGAFVGIGGGLSSMTGDGGFASETTGNFEGFAFEGDDGEFSTADTEGFGDGILTGKEDFISIEVGYDKQLGGNFVVGGFAGFDSSGGIASTSLDSDWSSNSFEGDGIANGSVAISEVKNIGARAGFLITPRTLFFATASLASATGQASIGNTLSDFFEDGSSLTTSASRAPVSVSGRSIGIGIEHQLRNNWSIKAELRQTKYDFEIDDGLGRTFEGSYDGLDYDGYTEGGNTAENVIMKSVRVLATKRF